MAAKPISMLQIRRIIQLLNSNESKRSIARQTGVSRNTVKEYLNIIDQLKIPLSDLLSLEDERLSCLIFDYQRKKDPAFEQEKYECLQKKFQQYKQDLEGTGVTRQLLWQEYKVEYPDGYGYSRFCHHINEFLVRGDLTMPMIHHPGEKVLVDFAGKTMSYYNAFGEEIKCQVFVAVFPFSGYSFTYAVHSQCQEDFLMCLEKALCYFGGVPACILGDNLKSYVKKASRYEPEFTELMQQFSVHYNTTLMATRVRKPKDKASVEKAVRLAYERIYAPLRNKRFSSIEEMNSAIENQLEHHHHRKFRGTEQSRKELFFEHEFPLLKVLPNAPLEVKRSVMAKVQKNYHVILGEDWHFYSVPHKHAQKQVKIEYTHSFVEIYYQHERIAVHRRMYSKPRNTYCTEESHMPENHLRQKELMGWDSEYFIKQAERISPEAVQVFERILNSRIFHQQAFAACIGILREGKKYGNDRLKTACIMALRANAYSYKFIKNVLLNGTDKHFVQTQNSSSSETIIPKHDNLRGAGFYQ